METQIWVNCWPSMETNELFILQSYSQCHGCWWPIDPRIQGINSHDIDLIILEYLCLSTRNVNTLRQDKTGIILRQHFHMHFMRKILIFCFKFHSCMFLRIQLTISQHWFRLGFGTKQTTTCYLNQWWPSSLMRKCVTRAPYQYEDVVLPVKGSPW